MSGTNLVYSTADGRLWGIDRACFVETVPSEAVSAKQANCTSQRRRQKVDTRYAYCPPVAVMPSLLPGQKAGPALATEMMPFSPA